MLEEDFVYNFIQDGSITLVLDEGHAGWTWAHVVARAINHELTNPAEAQPDDRAGGHVVVQTDPATAIGPKNVVVRIPRYELSNPARFHQQRRKTPLFDLPQPAACVTINRTTKNVSFTESVRVSPAVLQIPGVGTVRIGKPADEKVRRPKAARSDSTSYSTRCRRSRSRRTN